MEYDERKSNQVDRAIFRGKFLGKAFAFFWILMFFALVTLRLLYYYYYMGCTIEEALSGGRVLFDCGISLLLTISFKPIKRYLITWWLASEIKKKTIPLDIFFVAAVLKNVVDSPAFYQASITRAKKIGWLNDELAHEAIDASALDTPPKFTKTSGSSKIAYAKNRDLWYVAAYILAIMTLIGLGLLYDQILYFYPVPAIAPFLIIRWYRLDKYNRSSWLEASTAGVFFGEHNQLVSWEQITHISVQIGKSSAAVEKYDEYALLFYFDNGKRYRCDISTYQGGPHKAYHAMRDYSTVPVDIVVKGNS